MTLDEIDASEERRYQRDLKTAQQLRRQAAKLRNIGINSGSTCWWSRPSSSRKEPSAWRMPPCPHRERSAGAIRHANRGTHAKSWSRSTMRPSRRLTGRRCSKTGKRWINQGDRIVLLGGNGTGKSRLVGLIRRAIVEPQGASEAIRATPSLKLGYSDQNLSELAPDDTPGAAIGRRFDVGDQRARSLLAGAGLTIEMQDSPIGASPAGKRRG